MADPIDKKLYNKIKKLADIKFISKTSVYKSSWIINQYKKQGGKFKGSKPKLSGLKRWYKEKWIDLNRPIKNKKGIVIGYEECGRTEKKNNSKYPLCRPTYKISKRTPKTYKEISEKLIKKNIKQKSKVKSKGRVSFGGKKSKNKSLITGIIELYGGSGKGKKQYFGDRRKTEVLVKVPKDVKKVALYAFKLKKLGFKGATETGWKRAKQLATQDSIPIEDLRYMRNWFARHLITSYPTFKEWQREGRPKTKEWFDKRGIISWITWAGNPGFKWVNSKKNINLLNSYFNKNYKSLKNKV